MLSEMVERVARMLAAQDGMDPDAVSNDEDELPVWTLYIADARAVILTMREPPKDMVEAGAEKLAGATKLQATEWAKLDKFESYQYEAEDVFNSMIDAALTE